LPRGTEIHGDREFVEFIEFVGFVEFLEFPEIGGDG
jgi:hypothetical protein